MGRSKGEDAGSTPFAANAIYGVQKPSDCQVPSQVGSSHEFNRDQSWMLPRCGRFRVKRDTCVAYGHPSLNLGLELQFRERNLFPPRRFSYHTRFSRFKSTTRPCYLSFRVSNCTTQGMASGPFVGCSRGCRQVIGHSPRLCRGLQEAWNAVRAFGHQSTTPWWLCLQYCACPTDQRV
jgi:hypothetical protein